MKIRKYLLFWFIMSWGMVGTFLFIQPVTSEENTIISPLAKHVEEVKSEQVSKIRSVGLATAVNSALIGTAGKYAVIVKHLETGESYAQLEDKQYATASLYKLWLMATAFEQIKTKSITADQKLSAEIETLNKTFKIASEEAELHDGSISLTVQQAIEKAIIISDNYAALLLAKTVKTSNMQKFLQTNGLSSSKVGSPPKTTANDIATLYEKLYKGSIIDKKNSDEMIRILKRQALNDRIPKYLPQTVEVAHKTGELEGVKHDAGIVYSPHGDYILVVLSESDDPLRAAERIALISKNVYEYFQLAQ